MVTLHPLCGSPGSRLGELLGAGLEPQASLAGPKGCFERVVAAVSEAGDELRSVEGRLPAGPARPEAVAIRLRTLGAELRWGEPRVVPDLPSLLEQCRRRGYSSVETIRADRSLLSGMQVGSWFDGFWRTRALRRLIGRGARGFPSRLALASPRWLTAAADLAFWAGVREAASAAEWRRLTASAYTALVYHRFAGELKPGQERIDVSPRRFAWQLRALRLAGFRPLAAEEILELHSGELESLPARRIAITVDDAIADCVAPLRRHSRWQPQLFVPTRELGRSAHWIDGEPVATWAEVEDLARVGARIGSHTRHHRRLTSLGDREREEELAGSLADLRSRLSAPLEILAYPNGDHDDAVCEAARRAGYAAAFTTEKGKNGAGTDLYRLRRVSVHGRDGALAVLWKASTGEALPSWWLRLRGSRGASASSPS